MTVCPNCDGIAFIKHSCGSHITCIGCDVIYDINDPKLLPEEEEDESE